MKLRRFLDALAANSNPMNNLATQAYSGVLPEHIKMYGDQIQLYSGKVRDMLRKGEHLYMVHSDRLSAFDRAIGVVPCKGIILCQMSRFWMEQASQHMPTHFIEGISDRILSLRPMKPIKIEVVVRGYLAGSMQRAYLQGDRSFCGQSLPENLPSYGRLPKLMITPTTKADVFQHDENTSEEEIFRSGLVTESEWRTIVTMATDLFNLGTELYRSRGWILADTKYEFGRDAKGNISLIDEIHTPDSSRLWDADSYDDRIAKGEPPVMLDKENVRRYLLDQGFSGHGEVPHVPTKQLIGLALTYLNVCERLLGNQLELRGEPGLVDLTFLA